MNKMIVAVSIVLLAGALAANVIPVPANANDQQWAGANSTTAASAWYANPTATTGAGTLPALNKFVIPFQLPVLPAGQSITGVSLKAFLVSGLTSGSPQEVYVDVFAGRIAATSAAVAGDWDYGTQVGNNIAKIEKNAETANTMKNVALTASYFQSIYADDVNAAGKYIFLTLGPDATPAANSQIVTWATANNSTIANRPVLSITTSVIPEPATIGMRGLGALVSLRRMSR